MVSNSWFCRVCKVFMVEFVIFHSNLCYINHPKCIRFIYDMHAFINCIDDIYLQVSHVPI